ncbi:MAG: S1 RNA-binding domain-containing protein [Clostridiales bacterium]|nr:S1 RNA-binding domain-containing protein [Clostridiales bacterium]MDY4036304.1 S1 RNA-binding domain-containing protein [Candidatus Pseudoscilispira sp.]
MELGVGSILEGKVTGITKFGAFVSLGENKSGLVHISEIANTYVNDIHEHLQEGQAVKVKVLAIDENGRINLSIKRALSSPGQGQGQGSARGAQGGRAAHRSAGNAPRQSFGARGGARAAAPAAPMTAEESFEAKLKAFMTESEGKISDLNHSMDKRGRRR